MFDYTTQDAPKNRSELANEAGFTGTFAAFLDWLNDSLIYGGVHVNEPSPNGSVTVETVTGGFSSDEALLGRLRTSLWLLTSWVRSERGGIDVYEFPKFLAGSSEEREWLAPDIGRFETVHRARRIRVYDRAGGYAEFHYDAGAELLFQEPGRDIMEPDGLLIVRPVVPE